MDTHLTLTWHDTQESLASALSAAQGMPGHILVSARLPLLDDLTAAENIALPRTYHLGVNAELALLQARELAGYLLPPGRANVYPERLSAPETFAVLWLRAVAVPGRTVLIESPLATFQLSEADLAACAGRCHGLFNRALAHERRAQSPWGEP